MYVYILRSQYFPREMYIGLTANLKNRFNAHNRGDSSHSKKYRPWKIETAIWFDDREKAKQFERYLKSHSGRAFRSKHF